MSGWTFAESFVATIEEVRERLSTVTTWLWVDDRSGPCPPWAMPDESAAGRDTGGRVA